MRPIMLITLAAVAVLVFFAPPAWGVEAGEAAVGFQAGALAFDGKLGELFAADFAFGGNIIYGFSNYFALDLDFLYSEHEQSDRDKYGRLAINHGTDSLGVRASYHARHLAPYAALAPFVALVSYEAKYPAGSRTDQDALDSHGFGGMGQVGLDVYISGAVTLGLSGRVGVVGTDMVFATGADMDNHVEAYTFYSGLARLTLLF